MPEEKTPYDQARDILQGFQPQLSGENIKRLPELIEIIDQLGQEKKVEELANPNILSERYAKQKINSILSERGRILLEREWWIAVMKGQRALGANIPAEDIEKFEAAKEDIDLDLIRQIELTKRHDIKAKIEAFIRAAGAGQYLHRAMTSRDLSDNVEQIQIKRAAGIIFGKYISIERHFADKMGEYQNIILTARTHHQAAQPTLLGRRFSMWAEELLYNIINFKAFINDYPLRGIKGPVGTQFDMTTLLGNKERVAALEKRLAKEFGFTRILDSPGQVYPRSLDYELLSYLVLLSSACENFAKGIRLMAGYELVTEGFKEGQVGSTAMPHKMNTRSSERICSFAELLKMYADGASRITGDQWEEGDVSCSALRRVIIPDSFYTSDGLCETTLTVLNEMGAYPAVIDAETDRYFPFLATTEILNIALEAGMGRETAHKIIKEYAVSEALRMRNEGSRENNLATLLANDEDFKKAGITKNQIEGVLSDRARFVENAMEQMERVLSSIQPYTKGYKEEAQYEPKPIL